MMGRRHRLLLRPARMEVVLKDVAQ
jgi:hypothetical protein